MVSKDRVAEAWFQSYRWGDFAEDFFRDVLKFESVESIDFSAYQGASIIHDLGEPLPSDLLHKFDLAMDGGTLEHVFNFPVAIANLMKLVRMNGTVYLSGPCNNLCGHGFYQFSPELMYRVFSIANGFKPIFVRLAQTRYLSVELASGYPVYDVCDPDTVRQRVRLLNSKPVLIMVMAHRVADVEPFRAKVLQSDYVGQWDGNQAASRSGGLSRLKHAMRRVLPVSVMRHIVAHKNLVIGSEQGRKASLNYRGHYRRLW
jgi:hypothetical protein